MDTRQGNPSPAMAIAMFVLVYFVFAGLLSLVITKLVAPPMVAIWTGLIIAPTFVALLWMDAKDHGWKFADVMGGFPSPTELVEAVVMGLSLVLLASGVFWLLIYAASLHSDDLARSLFVAVAATETPSGANLVLCIVVVAIMGPICEEFTFRGILLRSWARIAGERKGLLWSAFCFAVVHGAGMPLTFMYGLMLGKLYLVRRSLVACMGAHVVINIAAISFQLIDWLPTRGGPGLEAYLQQGPTTMFLCFAGLVGTLVCAGRLGLFTLRRPGLPLQPSRTSD